MTEATKHIPIGTITSIADAVAHIHFLRQRGALGYDITPAMKATLDRIDVLPNYQVVDVIGLVELASILVNSIAAVSPEAAQAAIYLNRALPELHACVKQVEKVQGMIDN